MPLVSVVTPTYNGAHHLDRLLGSLARQREVDWEAIIVLDGSTDHSAEVVGRWEDRLPVRCIVLPENRGRAAALNAGFAAATGDVLVRVDDDLWLPPTFLAAHARHHSGAPVGVAGMCRDVFEDGVYARTYGVDADRRVREGAYTTASSGTWKFWAANASVTRSTYDLVGDYDEDFREYGWEDVDWGYRLHLAGVPIIVPPDVEAQHHGAPRTGRARADKAFASGAARRRFEEKHAEAGLPVSHLDRSLWNLAVRATAAVMRRASPDQVTRVTDAFARLAPQPVARKLISLGVESAGLAGLSKHSG